MSKNAKQNVIYRKRKNSLFCCCWFLSLYWFWNDCYSKNLEKRMLCALERTIDRRDIYYIWNIHRHCIAIQSNEKKMKLRFHNVWQNTYLESKEISAWITIGFGIHFAMAGQINSKKRNYKANSGMRMNLPYSKRKGHPTLSEQEKKSNNRVQWDTIYPASPNKNEKRADKFRFSSYE